MEVFNTHVGGVASAHNDARTQFEAFQNQRQSVSHLLQAQGHGMEVAYHTRLTATLDVTRFLLKQGLSFRGHDESLNSSNKGNFLELIEWYTQRNDEVAKTMNENAPGNNQMKSPTVQKDLTRACAAEVTNVILNDIKDNIFSLMNDIDELFAKHKLSLSRLRGQGYDGASNMRGEYNGLKALILKENSSARYVHCFAHQLQLVVVAVAKSNQIVSDFFQYVTMIVNITGASCKRKDKFRQLEHDRLVECLEKGDIVSVLENVHDDGTNDNNSGIATSLIDKMESYEFVFVMHLMKSLLEITNKLSLALQQKDQNIVLAVSLIKTMKVRLQKLRDEGWENFLDVVNKFCSNHMIPVPNMEENMRTRGCSRRNGQMITNFHHYRVEIFCQVLDMMVQEMSNRFSESSTEVLTCIACLDPKDSFSQFDIGKLLHLAELYLEDFSLTDRVILEDQLETYIQNVRVTTASVERVFSAMKIIKIDLRNRM
ncbi:zinc finger MYM-type protein 1-like [Zingiber officinale]|uniref:zinc finger MYM-type protein 1-like n=1 Tax=Zingiber officinale TaxID=94328 RepID=UPI001C4BDDDD|nr:zinc finger MYM-type protein 1-like [Zingiber officinale]